MGTTGFVSNALRCSPAEKITVKTQNSRGGGEKAVQHVESLLHFSAKRGNHFSSAKRGDHCSSAKRGDHCSAAKRGNHGELTSGSTQRVRSKRHFNSGLVNPVQSCSIQNQIQVDWKMVAYRTKIGLTHSYNGAADNVKIDGRKHIIYTHAPSCSIVRIQ